MKKEIRITSGALRGRKILVPDTGTHPMGAREKLALFNMIAAHLIRADVLDAFAGSGALGIEALSRGAKHVVFVEAEAKATEIIRKNLGALGLLEDTEVFQAKIRDFAILERKFDVIIADPPYDNFQLTEVELLADLVKDDGILVLSHPNEAPLLAGLTLEKTRSYAGAYISVYVK